MISQERWIRYYDEHLRCVEMRMSLEPDLGGWQVFEGEDHEGLLPTREEDEETASSAVDEIAAAEGYLRARRRAAHLIEEAQEDGLTSELPRSVTALAAAERSVVDEMADRLGLDTEGLLALRDELRQDEGGEEE